MCDTTSSISPDLNQIEALGDMTSIASGPEVSSVDIILTVATAACRRNADLGGHGHPMTGHAAEPAVRAVQHVIGLPVMVEYPQGPPVRVVALSATRAQALAVLVVTFMAIDTRRRRIFVSGGNVALFTRRYRVQPDQRECRNVVLEEYLRTPRPLVVAATALLTLLTLVDIVLLVAAVAICIEFRARLLGGVTALTERLGVGPAQGELRVLIVIEADLVPTRLGVAFGAIATEPTLMRIVEHVA
jgi:hypothetical protein